MKTTVLVSLLLVLGLVVLAIVNIWFDVVSATVFFKLMITAGLLIVVLLCIAVIKRNGSG